MKAEKLNKHALVKDLSFEINKGEIIALLSPENSGITDLLKIIAGLDTPVTGKIDLLPHNKAVLIPQNPSSLPWFNVSENFNLVSTNQNYQNEIVHLLGLEGYEKHYADNYSYGFRFLISLGMALLSGADLLLIDNTADTFSPQMKERSASVLRKIVSGSQKSIVYASCSINDAILFADRILLLDSSPFTLLNEYTITGKGKRSLEFLESKENAEIRNKISDTIVKLKKEKENHFYI